MQLLLQFSGIRGNFSISIKEASESVTYDHRSRRKGDPVRSRILKPRIGWLVVKWVTISESQLSYVFAFFLTFLGLWEWWTRHRAEDLAKWSHISLPWSVNHFFSSVLGSIFHYFQYIYLGLFIRCSKYYMHLSYNSCEQQGFCFTKILLDNIRFEAEQ